MSIVLIKHSALIIIDLLSKTIKTCLKKFQNTSFQYSMLGDERVKSCSTRNSVQLFLQVWSFQESVVFPGRKQNSRIYTPQSQSCYTDLSDAHLFLLFHIWDLFAVSFWAPLGMVHTPQLLHKHNLTTTRETIFVSLKNQHLAQTKICGILNN